MRASPMVSAIFGCQTQIWHPQTQIWHSNSIFLATLLQWCGCQTSSTTFQLPLYLNYQPIFCTLSSHFKCPSMTISIFRSQHNYICKILLPYRGVTEPSWAELWCVLESSWAKPGPVHLLNEALYTWVESQAFSSRAELSWVLTNWAASSSVHLQPYGPQASLTRLPSPFNWPERSI